MNIRQNTTFEFLYQKKATLPSEYISEFHKYWEENHEKVLHPKVNPNGECLAVGKVLENIYESNIIKVQLDTLNLTKEEIANVRFFLQFKISISMFTREVTPLNFIKGIPIVLSPRK